MNLSIQKGGFTSFEKYELHEKLQWSTAHLNLLQRQKLTTALCPPHIQAHKRFTGICICFRDAFKQDNRKVSRTKLEKHCNPNRNQ